MKYYGRKPELYKPQIKKGICLKTYCFRMPAGIDDSRPQINTQRTSLREAEQVRDDILSQRIVQQQDQVYEDAYLDKAIEAYLEAKRYLRPKSYTKYRQAIFEYQEHIRQQLGQIPRLCDTKKSMVIKYLNTILDKGLSNKTYNCKKLVLSNFYSYCVGENWVAKNFISDIPDLPVEEEHFDPLKREEINAILGYLRNERSLTRRNKCYYQIMAVIYFGGLRISEATHLLRDDINFEIHGIHIRNKYIKDRKYKTKTGRNWVAPMNEELEDILKQWLAQTKGDKTDLLFPNTKGRPIKNDLVAKEIKKVMSKLGFSPERLRKPLHGGRHAFCSYALQDGVPEFLVQRALGHKSNVMTKRYTHPAHDFVRSEFNKLNYRQKRGNGVK